MYKNAGNSTSENTVIFNSKLKEIKQFCEQQIQKYMLKEVINPKEELELLYHTIMVKYN